MDGWHERAMVALPHDKNMSLSHSQKAATTGLTRQGTKEQIVTLSLRLPDKSASIPLPVAEHWRQRPHASKGLCAAQ